MRFEAGAVVVAQRSLVLYEKSPAFQPAALAPSVQAKARRNSSCAYQHVATVERTFAPIGVASMSSRGGCPRLKFGDAHVPATAPPAACG